MLKKIAVQAIIIHFKIIEDVVVRSQIENQLIWMYGDQSRPIF